MPIFIWFNLKAACRIAAAVAAGSIFSLPVATPAQQDTPGASKIMVGTVEAPPFAMQTSNGDWEGLSIELWCAIDRELRIDYEFVTYDDLGRLKVDLETGALDLSIAMALTASHEADFDLSHPFLTSGSAIAIPVAQTHHSLIHFSGRLVDRFVSLEFLALISMLVILAFVAGALVWFFEGRHHGENFSGRPIKGIWQGLWGWAMVTMTTVGYGDKTPRTEFPGRIKVLPEIYDQYDASLAMLSGSTLREPLNRALLKIIATEEWVRVKALDVDAGG